MAQELDSLPDLWGTLQRLLRRLLKPHTRKSSSPAWSQDETSDEADFSGGWSAMPAEKNFVAEPVAQLKPKWTSPPIAKVVAPSQPAVQHALSKRLQDRRFLKQAMVVNELLNKPLALRRRGGLSNVR